MTHRFFTACQRHLLAALLAGLSPFAIADDYAQLQGFWQCEEEGVRTTLDFRSRSSLLYNGEAADYQLGSGMFRVQEEYGPVDYYYQLQQGTLVILSPEGYLTYCRKGTRPSSPPPRQAQGPGATPGWPPPYQRPPGRSTWDDSEPAKLLYKFAGRWDSASSNTLHNLYLKPDGSYEEAYEAGYSGTFTDQGGYQTGNWGATGAEQASGRWTIQGSLRQGQITLIDRGGKRTVYNYQVHCRGSECYGSEYFFNGKLYSVNYIYR